MDDINTAVTLETQLNVFSNFNQKLAINIPKKPYLFLANIDPEIQSQSIGGI